MTLSPHCARRAAGVLSIGLLTALWAVPAAAASGVTYTDTSAVGTITLCGPNGQQITSGPLATKPFAWRAVDSTAAPKDYGRGGTATLFGYQPRPGVAPGDWSGEQLTASAKYSNPAHPMAAATTIDESLANFVGDYPPPPSGQIQLRIYLGAPDLAPYTFTYDAAYLQISNGSWRQLDPGPANCSTGRALSIESAALPKKDFKVKPTSGATQQPNTNGSGAPNPAASNQSAGASAVSASQSPNASGATSAADPSGTSHTRRNLGIVIAVALLIAVGGALSLRHRT
jgi:hypothetical protein